MHRGSSSRSLRSISLFSRLPACVARLQAVQRDVSQKSRVIFRKTWSNRGKHGGFFPITPQFLAFSYADARRIPVHTELVRGGETSSSDFMHKLRCFLPFSSAGKLSGSTFRLHPYSFHRPFYNKTHSPRSLSQLSQNSQPKIPTCSDCPRTILYLISHFKNFSL